MKKLPQVDKMLFARDANGNIASFAVVYDSYTVHHSPGMTERDTRETAALLDAYPSQYVIRLREQPLPPLSLSTPRLLQMTCSSDEDMSPDSIVTWAKTMIN